jgi:hypothetical protein
MGGQGNKGGGRALVILGSGKASDFQKKVDLPIKISMMSKSKTKGGLKSFMAKWEYMIRKTDYGALNQMSFLDLERVRLTEHGEEGWELVAVTPSQNGESLILFLKRLVEEPLPLPPDKKKK